MMTDQNLVRQRLYKCFRDRLCSGRKPSTTTKSRLIADLYDKMYDDRIKHVRYHFAAGSKKRDSVYGLEQTYRPAFKIARRLQRLKSVHARLRVDSYATQKESWRNSRQLLTLHIMHERLSQFRQRC